MCRSGGGLRGDCRRAWRLLHSKASGRMRSRLVQSCWSLMHCIACLLYTRLAIALRGRSGRRLHSASAMALVLLVLQLRRRWLLLLLQLTSTCLKRLTMQSGVTWLRSSTLLVVVVVLLLLPVLVVQVILGLLLLHTVR